LQPTETRNEALTSWYEANRRSLPWRQTTDPWAILVSEVMLQQTQASRVAPAFVAFMDRFPTPAQLAEAESAELISTWAGLGYQRRAFRLREAAVMITDEGWPTSVDGLTRIPGVGPYTAAAVACFAFGAPLPAVDTNLRRVMGRWLGRAPTHADAMEVMDQAKPQDWNQAMMDLGATICTPRSPSCGQCPVQAWCEDPGFYLPPARQSAYQGSVRQARAAVLKLLADRGRVPAEMVAGAVGLDAGRVRSAIRALEAEGRVRIRAGHVDLED
jgi:A/G-specific adenine glycosylase